MLSVRRYRSSEQRAWDEFVARSKNGLFLFYRDYLEYHAARFADFSLMFYEGEKIVGIMPANLDGRTLRSHGGLTFGGVISDSRMTTIRMIAVFDALMKYAAQCGITTLVYKVIPHIYHTIPAQEDLYALFLLNGTLVRRDLSSAIKMDSRLPLSKGKKYGITKAKKAGLQVRQTTDFATYMILLKEVIRQHGTTPTHSLDEMTLLANRFPQNIKLFAAYDGNAMHAGVVIYEYGDVAHTQYMASNVTGKEHGALDLIINYLVEKCYTGFKYLSFGISTEQQGRYLNPGLIAQKEMFGARAVVHDFYELSVC